MPNFIDRTGQRFGRLVAISRGPNSKSGATQWFCKCDCGSTAVVMLNNKKRTTQSCGCILREVTARRNLKHGRTNSREYQAWAHMKQRIKKDPYYVDVDMDPRWEDFTTFYADMGACPKGYSIERVNNARGYWKDNCAWIPFEFQAQNTRQNRNYTINGITKCLAYWCREFRVEYNTARKRLNRGWTIAQALELESRTPSAKDRRLEGS